MGLSRYSWCHGGLHNVSFRLLLLGWVYWLSWILGLGYLQVAAGKPKGILNERIAGSNQNQEDNRESC
jgi:hypothetical protein